MAVELLVQTQFLRMEFAAEGRLTPWLGPAVRGMLAMHLKNTLCRWTPEEQQHQWRFCRGCPYQASCAYGLTFEPDPPPDWPLWKGQAEGQRAISLAPFFPVPQWADPGDAVQVRMTLIGRRAVAAGPQILQHITAAGTFFRLGNDRIRVAFTPLEAATDWPAGLYRLSAADLDASLQQRGRIPWLRLELLSPLFLQETQEEKRTSQLVQEPTFFQLFRACLRTVGRAFAQFGHSEDQNPSWLENYVCFEALKQLAEPVQTQAAFWRPFRQQHLSRRQCQRYQLRGIVGGAVFQEVPAVLLPWLIWGGRLGVGQYRVAGAGTWRILLY
ncbi:MAG: CRISPR system precrRNA processing endoribonuclease RAMP protein Cas6 [Thermoguttaceae bacterium]|nr:CRISPR system precrRNA processing endoribonuclease RAMP protein Cas6 [Thermoguttaceae bacterium]MDW8039643.1 CRISPR system precrRNA processing endoribonuclease RAMP protein Cas6 [Thermoguttaceae bacterium]